jgi:hypothetical protein
MAKKLEEKQTPDKALLKRAIAEYRMAEARLNRMKAIAQKRNKLVSRADVEVAEQDAAHKKQKVEQLKAAMNLQEQE